MDERTTRRLTEADRKILKAECRLGNMFLWIGAMGAFLFALFVILFSKDIPVALIGAAAFLLIGWIVCRFINKELNQDLANDQKVVAVKPIDNLETNPLLNENVSSSTAFDDRVSKYHTGYFVFSGRSKYPIDAATYELLKDQHRFEFHYAPESFTQLGIYPITK